MQQILQITRWFAYLCKAFFFFFSKSHDYGVSIKALELFNYLIFKICDSNYHIKAHIKKKRYSNWRQKYVIDEISQQRQKNKLKMVTIYLGIIPMCRTQPVDWNTMRGVKVLLQYIWFSSLCNRKETEDPTTMIVYHNYCHWFPWFPSSTSNFLKY